MPSGVYIRTEETKKHLKEKHKGMLGKKHSLESIKKMREAVTGRKISKEHKEKIAEANRGEKCHFWKGGISQVNKIIRMSLEYRLWRNAVFERDDYACIWCGAKSGIGKKVVLNADHIKPFALFPELRFAIDNGRTLCEECHKTTDTYAGRCNKNKFNK